MARTSSRMPSRDRPSGGAVPGHSAGLRNPSPHDATGMAPTVEPGARVAVPQGAALVARSLLVEGVVQGVGFRPFVWRLATELGLAGRVRNAAGRVEIDAAGPGPVLDAFARRLRVDAPPRARVERVIARPAELDVEALPVPFEIDESVTAAAVDRLFPPDIATCDDCLAELFDPADRRYRYPFTNCTNCGPRATIIEELPYDRARTTMRAFPLCPACEREYRDPANRRFHAEPVACAACGPRLAWRLAGASADSAREEAALHAAVERIRAGGIVAVKGLGGYHLACDATDPAVVERLRERKRRWAKPFAVMVADLGAVERLCHLNEAEIALLTAPTRPIVLLESRFRPEPPLAQAVAAGNRRLGVFLPYTPLHHLLLRAVDRPLVMTSANLSDEPLVIDDDDARVRLDGIADAFLAHDREIRARYDDSVTHVVAGRESIIRRGRGHAPEAIDLPVETPVPLLAVGAELKHTFTLARGSRAHVAPHNGDLEDLPTHRAFTDGLAHLSRLLALEPEVVVHDLHPEYLSTKYAVERFPRSRRIAVQHHHAHVASCAAEHGLTGSFLGVAYDGLGMGDDGTLWGGEILVANLTSYRRLARFGRAPLPGGAAAVKRPYRMALGYLLGAEGFGNDGNGALGLPDVAHLATPFLSRLDPREVSLVRTQIERGVNAPVASSAGRLFDAVAALLGLRDVAEYEAQAAIDLELAAADRQVGPLPYALVRRDGLLVYDPRPTIAALLEGLASHRSTGRLAAGFQETIATLTHELLVDARARTGIRTVCLSGGVFQNRRLASTLLRRLARDGFNPCINRRVPVNDGGISYGQAAVAAARLGTGAAHALHEEG
jgi:hydrogenase maturation protein HypF